MHNTIHYYSAINFFKLYNEYIFLAEVDIKITFVRTPRKQLIIYFFKAQRIYTPWHLILENYSSLNYRTLQLNNINLSCILQLSLLTFLFFLNRTKIPANKVISTNVNGTWIPLANSRLTLTPDWRSWEGKFVDA